MKLKQLALVFAGLLALSATQVFAEHDASGKHKVDADADGKVSYEEYRASKEKAHERQFKKMDANGDGYIDADEKQAQKDKMREMRKKRKQNAE
jgi:Ca2+-binding EF-hand superfamily protein